MDVREKLVEILEKPCGGIYSAYELADYLLDQGVTVQENIEISDELLKQLKKAPITNWKEEPSIELVQEWISVKDRLPELGERVICTDGDAVFEQYRVEHSCVYGMWDRCGLKSPMQEVTHWMPLPEPPKGE